MRVFGLVDLSLLRSIDLFREREEAEQALAEARSDDASWECRLWIAEIDLERPPSGDELLDLAPAMRLKQRTVGTDDND